MSADFAKTSKSTPSLDREIFNQTQGGLVDAVNSEVDKKSTPFNTNTTQVTYSGPKPTPSSQLPPPDDNDGEKEVRARYSQDTAHQDGSVTSRYYLKPDVGNQSLFGEKARENAPADDRKTTGRDPMIDSQRKPSALSAQPVTVPADDISREMDSFGLN
jgi:hypothetical protein